MQPGVCAKCSSELSQQIQTLHLEAQHPQIATVQLWSQTSAMGVLLDVGLSWGQALQSLAGVFVTVLFSPQPL